VRTSHAARRKSTSSWGLPQSNIISADGQAVDSSRRDRDIEEQVTGVELAPELRQIVPITTTPGVGSRQGQLYSTPLNRPRGTTFCSTLWRGFHQLGPPISAYKFKPPREVSPRLLLCSALAIPHHCFSPPHKLKRNESRITPPFPPHLRGSPHGFRVATSPSLSLSLCPGLPTFRHSKA
jgi:hypothetical protein